MTAALKTSPKPSIALAIEHHEIRERLRHLSAALGTVNDVSPKDRRRAMDQLITFVEEHIEHHTRRENEALFPVVEKHLGSPWLTAALRVEHRFMLQTVDALRRVAAEPEPDAETFISLVDNLIGLFIAHCCAEEEILFPVVDEMAATGVKIAH